MKKIALLLVFIIMGAAAMAADKLEVKTGAMLGVYSGLGESAVGVGFDTRIGMMPALDLDARVDFISESGVNITAISAGLYYNIPTENEKLTPFLGAGACNLSASAGGVSVLGSGVFAGAGISYRLEKQLAFLLDVRVYSVEGETATGFSGGVSFII